MALDRLDAEAQFDSVCTEVRETFGQLDAPDGRRSHLWRLDLHGVTAEGATEEEVIANWKRLNRPSCSGGIAA
jgi:hypothetical protein